MGLKVCQFENKSHRRLVLSSTQQMLGEFRVELMQKVRISQWLKPQINTMECGPPIKKVFKNNKPWLIIGLNRHL